MSDEPYVWKVMIGRYLTFARTLTEAGSLISNTFDETKLPVGLVITIEKEDQDDE